MYNSALAELHQARSCRLAAVSRRFAPRAELMPRQRTSSVPIHFLAFVTALLSKSPPENSVHRVPVHLANTGKMGGVAATGTPSS